MDEKYFSISDVLGMDDIPIYKKRGSELYFRCPDCGRQDEKCSGNTGTNFWHCFHCGAGGNPITLHMHVKGIDDPKAAARDLHEIAGDTTVSFRLNIEEQDNRYSDEPIVEGTKASDMQHAKVYSVMSRISRLSQAHKENLLKRGLSEQDIKDGGFFDITNDGYAFCRRLVNEGKLKTSDLDGIAGFYDGYAGKTVACVKSRGFFCPAWYPVKTDRGWVEIKVAGQISQPETAAKAKAEGRDIQKYIWFSSADRQGGVSSGARCSVLKGTDRGCAIVTEGTLKAFVTWCLLGRRITVISVPGIRSLRYLKGVLTDTEIIASDDVIIEAYDMDKMARSAAAMKVLYDHRDQKKYGQWDYMTFMKKKTKDQENIADAQHKLWSVIDQTGHKHDTLSWDIDPESPKARRKWNGNIKGIDDFLNASTPETRELFYKLIKRKKGL